MKLSVGGSGTFCKGARVIRSGVLSLIALLATLPGLAAQQAGDEPPAAKRSMRLLAVGDLPTHREIVVDGVRQQLPAKPGSVPPRQVLLGTPKPDGSIEEAGIVDLTLGRLSRAVEVPAGAGVVWLRESAEAEPWVRVDRPEEGDFLVVLWRDEEAGTWDKAKAWVVRRHDRAGTVGIVNVAPGPLVMILGDEKAGDAERLVLAPGRPVFRPLAGGDPVACKFGLKGPDGGFERAWSGSLEQAAHEWSLVVLSKSDGERPRGPLKVTTVRQALRR